MEMGLHRFQSGRQRVAHLCAGQALVEYALILTFISVLCIAVLSYMGIQIRGIYTTIIDALDQVRTAI